jgi:hypothetical protein
MMTLKVEVSDEAAARLRAKASQDNSDPEVLASRLLTDALGQEDDWSTINQRRVDLIRVSGQRPLSDEEKAELQKLQEAADQHVDAQDRALQDRLSQLEAAIDGLS